MKMSEKLFRRYFQALFKALRHLHAYGIIHRDVKPGNFLSNGRDRFLLVDYGLAQNDPKYDCKRQRECVQLEDMMKSVFQRSNEDRRAGTIRVNPRKQLLIDRSSQALRNRIRDTKHTTPIVSKIGPGMFKAPQSPRRKRSGVSMLIRRSPRLAKVARRVVLPKPKPKAVSKLKNNQKRLEQQVQHEVSTSSNSISRTLKRQRQAFREVLAPEGGRNSECSVATDLTRQSREDLADTKYGSRYYDFGVLHLAEPPRRIAPIGRSVFETCYARGGAHLSKTLDPLKTLEQRDSKASNLQSYTSAGTAVSRASKKRKRKRSLPSAPRSGTRGFRALEVLLRVPEQTAAIDVWSAGVIMLCILSKHYPFYHASDDSNALLEVAQVHGFNLVSQIARQHDRKVTLEGTTVITNARPYLEYLEINLGVGWKQEAFQLMKRCLDLSPTTRATAEEILCNKFFQSSNDR
ncbi:hypothetical protein AAMO2058_000497400 [Amorphochlora amoebiformis]